MNPGQDNDTAATAKIIGALRALSNHTGAVVIGIDHFGKVVETGTRGSSNKEASADAVLVTLGDRELNGTIKNTRLAVRKQRDGARAGSELPFIARVIEVGVDEDGDPETAVILDWQTERPAQAQADAKLTVREALAKRSLANLVCEIGETPAISNLPHGFKAVRREAWGERCYRDGFAAEAKTDSTRRSAFHRVFEGLQVKAVIGVQED